MRLPIALAYAGTAMRSCSQKISPVIIVVGRLVLVRMVGAVSDSCMYGVNP